MHILNKRNREYNTQRTCEVWLVYIGNISRKERL